MAGVDVGGGGGKGKRSLDSEINMIPFIDLLMVTISFLLITAVWSHMARINADAQVPGPPDPTRDPDKIDQDKVLHLEMRQPDKFVLSWKQGTQTTSSIDVPRKDDLQVNNGAKSVRYGTVDVNACGGGGAKDGQSLAQALYCEWTINGSHRAPSEVKRDQAVLHTDNDTQYVYLIGVIDALYQTHRPLDVNGKTVDVPAFNVTFAVN